MKRIDRAPKRLIVCLKTVTVSFALLKDIFLSEFYLYFCVLTPSALKFFSLLPCKQSDISLFTLN